MYNENTRNEYIPAVPFITVSEISKSKLNAQSPLLVSRMAHTVTLPSLSSTTKDSFSNFILASEKGDKVV